jgi:hypothetical protein
MKDKCTYFISNKNYQCYIFFFKKNYFCDDGIKSSSYKKIITLHI